MQGDRPAVSAAMMRKGGAHVGPHVSCRARLTAQQAAEAAGIGYSAGTSP